MNTQESIDQQTLAAARLRSAPSVKESFLIRALRVPTPPAGELRIVEELGPRGRSRVLGASIASAALLLAGFAWILRRFQIKGQFAPELWRPFKIWGTWRFLLRGVQNTLIAFVISLTFALSIGILMAMWRGGSAKPKKFAATFYVEVFRACSLLVLIRFSFFQLGRSFPSWKSNWIYGLAAIVIGCTLYYSTVFAEVIRSSLRSLSNGQREAGLAIGLRDAQAMRLVLLPQALRRALPNLFTQAASLLKDTSLGSLIIFEEIVHQSDIVGSAFENKLQTYLVAWTIYFVLVASLTSTAKRVRRRQEQGRKTGAATPPMPTPALLSSTR
jgi:glutamate transport system permease protein